MKVLPAGTESGAFQNANLRSRPGRICLGPEVRKSEVNDPEL